MERILCAALILLPLYGFAQRKIPANTVVQFSVETYCQPVNGEIAQRFKIDSLTHELHRKDGVIALLDSVVWTKEQQLVWCEIAKDQALDTCLARFKEQERLCVTIADSCRKDIIAITNERDKALKEKEKWGFYLKLVSAVLIINVVLQAVN